MTHVWIGRRFLPERHGFGAGGVPAAYPLFQAGGGGSIPTSALLLRVEEDVLIFRRP